MFWHLYKYRIKSLLSIKEDVFWSILFPIFLATCFYIAFSSIGSKAYDFHSIPVAVVYQDENSMFQSVLSYISTDTSQGEPFLTITETDIDSAENLLLDDQVDAILTVSDTIQITVAKRGLNQTAVQSFVNEYLQQQAIVMDILSSHPESLDDLITSMNRSTSYIKEITITSSNVDPMIFYYLSLIAMASLFGGFFGLETASQLKANLSPVGMRKCIGPQNRILMIIAEFLATYTLQFISISLLLLYMTFILKINLGNQLGYIIGTCCLGCMVGVASGFFVGSLPKLKENTKIAIFLIYSMVSSFLSGLMISDLKLFLQHNLPIINQLNPATLIQDSLYSLLIYNTHERYFDNIITLGIYSIILCILSYFMTRREQYANL